MSNLWLVCVGDDHDQFTIAIEVSTNTLQGTVLAVGPVGSWPNTPHMYVRTYVCMCIYVHNGDYLLSAYKPEQQ